MIRKSVYIYQFSDFNFDEFIKQFLFEISEHTTTDWKPQLHPDELIMLGYKFTSEKYKELLEEYNTIDLICHKAKRGVRNPDVIKCKVQYLQHIIIRRAHSKKDLGTFSLNSQILKAVIGDEYKTMLSILLKMGFLRWGDGKNGNAVGKYYFYNMGCYSRIYSIPNGDNIEKVITNNAKVIKYLQKESEQMERYRDTVLRPIIDSRFGKYFQKEYEISLSKICIIDDKGFEQFVEQRLKEDPEGKIYYEYVREGLCKKDKHIQKVDKAGRIYHILTNTKREVKQFLNIAISADCKNSHPVLFNYFIFQAHNISAEDAQNSSRNEC